MRRLEIRLFNTMSRELEAFEPMDAGAVGVYTCGPTVYHHAHIGNLRTYIVSDVLVKVLRLRGYGVRHVMNITDVGHLTSDEDEGEDKMEVGASREGISAWQIAERYTKSFFEQCELLNIRRPDVVCRATDHIAQQIAMIEKLQAGGFVYETEDGIYFDTTKMPSYGDLARLDLAGLRAGARVDVGSKHNNSDFAVWKFSRDQKRQMEWDSPWGRGFPGWHIECSAMSTFYLGDQFDIHTGGIDHIPVHHTNEIAQSEAATGRRPFVRYWLHSNFLQLRGDEKMAKSSNEFLTVDAFLQRKYDPLAYRLLCLKAHYRSDMKFTWEALEGAAVQYRRLRSQLAGLLADASQAADNGGELEALAATYAAEIEHALYDDLSTPVALTALQRALADAALPASLKIGLVERFDAVFGLDLLDGAGELDQADLGAEVNALVAQRETARAQRDWPLADRLRKRIEGLGYSLEDTSGGTKIQRVP
jgi:cysteinyl-tRNA synthetase